MSSINDYIKKAKVVSYCLTRFLDSTESSNLRKVKDPTIKVFYNGGYSEAERVRAFIIDKKEQDPEINEFEIGIVKLIPTSDIREITHRHVLGTIMSFGIKRELIGDIIVKEEEIYIFVVIDIIEFLLENIKEINKIKVDVQREDICNFINDEKEETKLINVASLRLDAVISKVLNLSRTKAVEIIEKGLVQINHIECENISYFLKCNDLISVRHFGRIQIIDVVNKTKKDRLVLEVCIKH